MTLLIRIFCFSAGVLAAPAVIAQTLPIYVAPTTDHGPVARASVSGKAIAKVTPVLEVTKKAEGWFWAEYTGPFDGYIASGDFANGEKPRAGSIVYAQPSLRSPVVTTVEEGDLGALAERTADGAFVRVNLNKTIGIYFNAKLSGVKPPEIKNTYVRRSGGDASRRTPPAVQPPPVVVSAPAPKPVAPRKTETPESKRAVTASKHPQPKATPKTEAVAPPVVTRPPQVVETSPPRVRPVAAPAPTPAPRKAPEIAVTKRRIPLPPVVIENSITLSGTLVQSKRRWLVIKPETDYMLVDGDGDRMAWVRLEGAVLSRPLPELLGSKVTVYGEWRKRDDDAKVILQARSLRLEL